MNTQLSMSLPPASPIAAPATPDQQAVSALSRAEVAQRNRELMPEISAFVDLMRQVDPTLKVRWAYENGHEVGRRPEYLTDADLQALAN